MVFISTSRSLFLSRLNYKCNQFWLLTSDFWLLQKIALQNPQDIAVKKSAKRAMTMLRGIAADLPSDEDLVAIYNQLPDLMGKMF